MTALFSRRSTLLFRALLTLGALTVVGVPVALMFWVRSPPATGVGRAPAQPMWFDHREHVASFKIDCRYCHSSVERSATAGMPATRVCVPCHNDVWLKGPAFAPVRRSLASGAPIPWRRVNSLPDFAYFDHSIHVRKGVGCESCHGRVDRMRVVSQAAPLTMDWCVSCHANPAPSLRPVEEVTTMGWRPSAPQAVLGPALMRRYRVKRMTDCSACHR
jgi:hypothetical protein